MEQPATIIANIPSAIAEGLLARVMTTAPTQLM
jgi:hypothetical protein